MTARPAETYRAARRNSARRQGLIWRLLLAANPNWRRSREPLFVNIPAETATAEGHDGPGVGTSRSARSSA